MLVVLFWICLGSLIINRVSALIPWNPDSVADWWFTCSQTPYNLGCSVIGFTSVFLYQILNRYSKLFGIMSACMKTCVHKVGKKKVWWTLITSRYKKLIDLLIKLLILCRVRFFCFLFPIPDKISH